MRAHLELFTYDIVEGESITEIREAGPVSTQAKVVLSQKDSRLINQRLNEAALRGDGSAYAQDKQVILRSIWEERQAQAV
jgi:hypothetical protein